MAVEGRGGPSTATLKLVILFLSIVGKVVESEMWFVLESEPEGADRWPEYFVFVCERTSESGVSMLVLICIFPKAVHLMTVNLSVSSPACDSCRGNSVFYLSELSLNLIFMSQFFAWIDPCEDGKQQAMDLLRRHVHMYSTSWQTLQHTAWLSETS